nr:MAG TPA: hypothetical protein [Caudoviricetes sp.]
MWQSLIRAIAKRTPITVSGYLLPCKNHRKNHLLASQRKGGIIQKK